MIGGRKGQERPRLSRRGTVTTQPIQVPLADTDAVPATESDASDQVETAPSETDALTPPPIPPVLPSNPVTYTAAQDSLTGLDTDNSVGGATASQQVCAHYMSGECQYGISGKSGGNCPDKHPKRCALYIRWGDRDGRGCSGTTCGKAHPTLCPNSLDLKCFDRHCSWRLHTERCQRGGTAGGSGWTNFHHGKDRGGVRGRPPQKGYGQGQWGRDSENYRGRGSGGGQFQHGGERTAGGGQFQHGGGKGAGGGQFQGRGAGGVQSQHGGERGFQGMTAQQDLLGAGSLTGFQQQLQEAVTRAIVAAMASTRVQGGWPAMGGFPANSGLGAPQNQQ